MPNTTGKPGRETSGTESQYALLCASFPPRAIVNARQMKRTQAVIDGLLDMPGKLTRAEREYLNTLGTLVAEYEARHCPVPTFHGVELLRELMADRGLSRRDVMPAFKTEAALRAVLSGRRELSAENIQALARLFHVPAAAFLPDPSSLRVRVA